jgi:hypothetical protein
MIKIDDSLLEELGLIGLPKAERDKLLKQIYETLEMRVGMKLAERMSDQQLDEFERFIDTNDEAGALQWLETNFPDYKQVVASELEVLKAEIKKDSAKIIEALQAGGSTDQAPVVSQPAPQQIPADHGTPMQQPAQYQQQPAAPQNVEPIVSPPPHAPQRQEPTIPPPPYDLAA